MISAISRKRRRRNDSLCGFTLIELVLVTLIILIVIGLSTPLFRRTFSDLTLKDTAYNISSLINYGQEKAIIERKNFKMSFNFQSSSYRLWEIDNSTDPPTDKEVKGKFGRTFTLPRDISFRPQKDDVKEQGVIFYPDGHSDEMNIEIFNTKREKEGYYRLLIRGFGRRIEIDEIESGQ